MITTGQLGTARRMLRRSIAELAPHVGAGVPVVGLEPSCTAVLRGDAAELLGTTPEVTSVARATRTLAELLGETRGWTPPPLGGARIVAQPHCHHRSVMGWSADRELLERAGTSVHAVDGCCGLAGNFGVERGHYETSVLVAETALLPAVRGAGEDSTLLADGFSCRTQLDQLARRKSVHLAELLAAAGRHRQADARPPSPTSHTGSAN